jgi:hypothetical protein
MSDDEITDPAVAIIAQCRATPKVRECGECMRVYMQNG